MEDTNRMKTGTTTLAMLCKEGIVVAADKRATAGNFIADPKVLKIHPVTDNIVVTMAGTVSDAQLMVKLAKANLQLKKLKTYRDVSVKEAANFMAGMVYSNIRKMSTIPGVSHFIMAGKDDKGFHVYDIYADGSITEVDTFISSGSGSVMAYGVLETLYKKGLSVKEGKSLAIKAINAALARDSASGNGIDMTIITEKGVEKMPARMLDTRVKE